MLFSKAEVMEFVENEDVKFIRLAFCDVFGVQKNISIMPTELERAFEKGISFDGSTVEGFVTAEKSDLLLFPDPSTLSILPWRPSHGKVVRLFCDVRYPDGRPLEADCRYLLRQAVQKAKMSKLFINFGSEFEFYLFTTDEFGNSTGIPHDNASYLDVSPDDKGENVRREICLTLEQMGMRPESSHHEVGPGQHEVDFKYNDALTAADNAITFKWAVRTIADKNGLFASFSPKPIPEKSGNGMHINISPDAADGSDVKYSFMAGILKYINEITIFMNSTKESFMRLGEDRAPRYVTWSSENCSQLVRVPKSTDEYSRIELRSPDCCTNPYLAYALLIYAGLAGIEEGLIAPEPCNRNLLEMSEQEKEGLQRLPMNIEEAVAMMRKSAFVYKNLPQALIDAYSALADQ